MAATIGVPLYACGGGTIPLLQQWLLDGMSIGSAASFMITGPATKITNLGALKIVLGMRRFLLYLAFVMLFSLVTGLVVNLFCDCERKERYETQSGGKDCCRYHDDAGPSFSDGLSVLGRYGP